MPSKSANTTLPSPPLSRKARKKALIETLEQQRIDIMVDTLRIERAVAPADAGWQQLMRYRKPLYLLGGILAWKLTRRRPLRLVLLGKKALAGYAIARKVRHLVR